MYQRRKKKILSMWLTSMVEAEKFSDHPRLSQYSGQEETRSCCSSVSTLNQRVTW